MSTAPRRHLGAFITLQRVAMSLTDPTSLLVVAITVACLLVGLLVFASPKKNRDDDGQGDNKMKKPKSLVDMSNSLKKEEDGTVQTAQPKDDRVLNPIQFRTFKVLQIKKISPNTKLIRFEIPHGRPLGLAIGKHISIQAHLDGHRTIRAYTPSSLIDQPGYFDLVVKAYEFGKLSPYLHNLKPGQEVEVRGPVGRFKYAPNSYTKMGLIAGGTGLTPCLQVIRTVLECTAYQEDRTRFVLFFQNRSEDDILLQDELLALQRKFRERLEVFFFLSNATTEYYGQESHERKGYISTEMMQLHMHIDHCQYVGICGPSGFNDFAKKKLHEVGHHEQTVFVW